jgi:hypothetical protein
VSENPRPTFVRNGITRELMGTLITYGPRTSKSSYSETVFETPDEVQAIREAAESDMDMLKFRNMNNPAVPAYIRAESIISITPFWDMVEKRPTETP